MKIINLGQADGLPPVGWAAVAEKLDAGSAPAPEALNSRTTWLATVNEDGSPHVTAVGALWLDGTFWFQTGAGTRKGRNVARDPRCSIAVSIRDADVVIEGDACGLSWAWLDASASAPERDPRTTHCLVVVVRRQHDEQATVLVVIRREDVRHRPRGEIVLGGDLKHTSELQSLRHLVCRL